MSQVDVSVKVEQSGYDAVQHLAKLIKAVKAAGGFSISAIPADVAALVAELPGLVGDISQMPADLADSKLLFAKGVNVAAYDLVEAILG